VITKSAPTGPLGAARDKSIHDNVDDIAKERRNGYAWYTDAPKRMLEHYAGREKFFVK
jgi:hypothetical protein